MYNDPIQEPKYHRLDGPKDYKSINTLDFKSKYKRANPLIAISIGIGLSVFICIIIHLVSSKAVFTGNSTRLIQTSLILLLPIIGFAIGIGMYLNEQKNKQRCTQIIIGKCIELNKKVRTDSDGDISILYIPTFSYQVNDENFTIVSDDTYNWLTKPSIGSDRKIMTNPSDPGDAFVPQSMKQIIETMIICWMLIIGGFIGLYIFINK